MSGHPAPEKALRPSARAVPAAATTTIGAWPPARRRGRPGYDRETLIRVCVETFNRHGYEATSMGMLAQELGLCKSAIYHHVESKEAILETALDRALTCLEQVLEEARGMDLRPVAELEHVLSRCVRTVTGSVPYMTLLMRLRGNSEVERCALDRRHTLTLHLEGLIARAQAEGDVHPDADPGTSSWIMTGIIASLVDWYSPERVTSVEDLAYAVVQTALAGLRQTPGSQAADLI